MSDITILAALVKTTLHEIANQSSALGTALHNAAPGDKANSPNNSIQYLLAAADDLEALSDHCDEVLEAPQDEQQSPPQNRF